MGKCSREVWKLECKNFSFCILWSSCQKNSCIGTRYFLPLPLALNRRSIMIGGKGKRKKGKRKEVKRRGEGKKKEKKMLLSMLQYTSEMYHKKNWDEYDTETKAGSHIKACPSSDAFLRSPRGKSLLKSLKSYIVSQSPARRQLICTPHRK